MPIKASDAEIAARKDETLTKYWMGEIDNALKREKKFRENAQKVVNLYEARTPDLTPFNIIYSNTETLAPALYNARPIPIVTRRFKDPDPIGKAVAETSTRILKFLIDTEDEDYDTFDELTQAAVLDVIVTNRGLTRFKYVPHEDKSYSECVYGEAVRWDKFFHGYARTWKKVPWIGFEWDMSKDELKKNFKGVTLDFRNMVEDRADSDQEKAEDRDELAGVKTYKVYEIWDKSTRKVYFFSGCSLKKPLRVTDDPLKLQNFFPVPKPMNLMRKITTLVPTPLYEQYRSQAAELNELTRRLKAVIKACKYRGMYNAAVEGIDKMLKAEDNDLVPVENVQSMPDGTGMDKLIWTVPTQELAQTAQTLYQQREQCKQVIYEITGISDILRGASVASETATAQNIKNQWGTLRLKKMQKEVQRYCRDALSIQLEIAATNFDIETLQGMTGLPYLRQEQKQQIQQQMAMAQAAQQQPPMPGQPPPPPPPEMPPMVQLSMSQPSWEEVQQGLQNDIVRHYKTDIETNSTIDAEAAQDKQDIADLLNALGQFMNSIGPLVESGAMPFDVAKEMLLVISRRYNFGGQLEEGIQAMQSPQAQQGPDPTEQAKMQAEAEATQAEMALKKQEFEQEMALSKMEFQQKQQEMGLKAQIAMQELEIKRQELAMQKQMLQLKSVAAMQQHQMKMEAMRQQALVPTRKEPSNAE